MSTNAWVVDPFAFLAVNVIGNVPPPVGVPASVAVPLALVVKVTPPGSAPDRDRFVVPVAAVVIAWLVWPAVLFAIGLIDQTPWSLVAGVPDRTAVPALDALKVIPAGSVP